MYILKIILLAVPFLFFSSCKSGDEDVPEDTTWRDKSAREKLDSMQFNSVMENVSDKIDGIDERISSVTLVVNYDDEENLWLTGLGATNQKKVKTLAELSDLLSLIPLKGDAVVSYRTDKKESPTSKNTGLENTIISELRNQGFSCN